VQPIPVVALTGYLGAGKTSLLNHVLHTPEARIGVVINDFGELNVDALLVTGAVGEPASIAGGCVCCLSDDDALDDALAKLADPRLKLDAIVVEASGLADPVAIARLIRFSGVDNVRFGGLVDVIDAARYFETVDRGEAAPARYSAASLVVVNKLDQLFDSQRDAVLEQMKSRVQQRNPYAIVVGAVGGRIDPALLYDVSGPDEEWGQLSLRGLLFDDAAESGRSHHHDHNHTHADSVSVTSSGCIDVDGLVTLLEEPPPGVYRLKGTVAVRYRSTVRTYVVNLVGASVHVAAAPAGASANCLVAIGIDLDVDDVRARLDAALTPHAAPASAASIRRLQRYRQLSI